MSYVPRRIQTIKKDGKTETISDQEFSALEAPLVLLGEPGAGKTETAHAISEARHSPALTSQQSRHRWTGRGSGVSCWAAAGSYSQTA